MPVFDWGTASSEHQLAASWTGSSAACTSLPAAYSQARTILGGLIQKELDKDVEEPPFKRLNFCSQSQLLAGDSFHRTLGEVVQRVEQFTQEPEEALAALQAEASSLSLSASSTATTPTEPASARMDSSLASLQSGNGNFPLHLKLELAHHLGSFDP